MVSYSAIRRTSLPDEESFFFYSVAITPPNTHEVHLGKEDSVTSEVLLVLAFKTLLRHLRAWRDNVSNDNSPNDSLSNDSLSNRHFIEFYQTNAGDLNAHVQWNEFYHRNTHGVLKAYFNHINLFTVHDSGVSRLWQAYAMGATLTKAQKIAWQKLKLLIYNLWK